MKNKRSYASKNPDYILFFAILALVGIGFLALASASAIQAKEKFDDPYYYLKHQLIYGFSAGLFFGYLAYKIRLKFFEKLSLPVLLLTFFLLILVFLPSFGFVHGGAQRWIILGPISLQPAEIAKFTYILFLANWLKNRQKEIKSFWEGIFPFLVMTGFLAGLLILQPAVGTTGIILISAAAMYFAAGGKIMHIAYCGILGILLLLLLIKIAPYRIERIQTFLNPDVDPLGISYQVNQALIAIGSGGISGSGFGNSSQRYHFIPEPMGDSVFAIYAEETGYIGSVFLIGLFILFAWRGLKIAINCQDKFAKLACVGIVSWMTLQAFINIAGISKVLPLTGVPLPFISYGGSALAITMAASGLLLNISKHTND